MKTKSQYSSIENYRIDLPQGHIEHRFLNRKSNADNKTFESQKKIFKKNKYNQYPTIEQEELKSNKIINNFNNNNLNNGKYFNKQKKGYFYRNFYNIEKNQTDGFKVIEDYDDYKGMNLKPFGQSTKENGNNNKENNYPSNYSYYEYKYFKKKKSVPMNLSNHNFFEANSNHSIFNSNEKNKNSLKTISLNKSHQIQPNEDYNNKTNNSPYTKKSDNNIFFNKIKKDKINSEADNKKRILILKNSYNIRNVPPFEQDKNNTYIKTISQPRTPILVPNNVPHSPIKKFSNGNYNQQTHNFINYNKREKNYPSLSIDKLTFNKYVSINPSHKKEYTYKKSLDKLEEKIHNITEPFILNSRKPPSTPKQVLKIKSFEKINTILDKNDKYNNNFTIAINDTNENKNIIKNMNFNGEIKPNQKNEKFYSKLLQRNKNNIKSEQNLSQEQKINKLKGIKNEDFKELKKITMPFNTITKNIIYKNKNNGIENKTNFQNKDKKISNIIIRNPNNYKDEYDYMKQVDNNKNDTYIEPKYKIKYIKESKNTEINDDKNKNRNIYLNNNEASRGKNEIYKKQIYLSSTDIKNNIKNDINIINKKSKKYFSNSNTNIFGHSSKSKSNDITFGNINNNLNKSLNNNKNNKNIQTVNNINKTKIENKINSYNKNKSYNFNISKKESDTEMKNKILNFSNLSKLNIDEPFKDSKQKFHRNLTELPRHLSRLDEVQKKSTKKKGKKFEEWEKLQYKGMRKKTYDARRLGKKNKFKKDQLNTSIDEQFSSTVYVKASEGFSLAGRNESGNKKTNQDTYVIEKNINGILNFNIFGVLDGHGDDGHFVSQFVNRYVIHRIKNHPLIKKLDEPKEIYNQLKSKGYEILSNIFIDADAQIQKEKFDSTRSGTTIVLVIQLEEKIICANTGDSRAIAIYDERKDDNLAHSKIFHLSYDCKPNLPNEKRRIYESGGVVEKAYYSDDEDDERIPFRVWAKDGDYPGLAMSRSIGDMDAKKVGVIPDPQFVEYTIDNHSKYLLICSDGIWEFMPNEQAMKIANKFYLRNDPKGLCHELSQESIKLWEEKEVVIDDITIVVVFF